MVAGVEEPNLWSTRYCMYGCYLSCIVFSSTDDKLSPVNFGSIGTKTSPKRKRWSGMRVIVMEHQKSMQPLALVYI